MSPLKPTSFFVPRIRGLAFKGQRPPLEQPTGLVAVPTGQDVVLSWDHNAPNATGYVIYRSTALFGPYLEVAQILGKDGPLDIYMDETGQSTTNFCYRVQAFSETQSSVVSNVACAITE